MEGWPLLVYCNMKKLLLLFVMVVASLSGYAQSMSVASFEAEPSDLDARVYFPKIDQNNEKAALIKVETTQKGFAFDVGSFGIVDVDHTRIAETWVYVPHGVIQLTIFHEIHGRLRYEIPISIEAATVYRLKLTTSQVTTVVEQSAGGQYLLFNITPESAEVIVDDGAPMAIEGGQGNIFLPYGNHSYVVQSRLYKSASGTVAIGAERAELNVDLEPDFGYLNISSEPSGADVEINDMFVGKTPYTSSKMPLGSYNVRLSLANYAPVSQSATLLEAAATVNVEQNLQSYLSTIIINCSDNSASIIINGAERGKGSWKGELLPGTYELKAEKSGHRASVQQLVVERSTSRTISLAAPTPMYGSLNISSALNGVEVALDGKSLGTLPNIFSNILAGSHTLTFSKQGYITQTATVEVAEGKMTAYNQAALVKEEENKSLHSIEQVKNNAQYYLFGEGKAVYIGNANSIAEEELKKHISVYAGRASLSFDNILYNAKTINAGEEPNAYVFKYLNKAYVDRAIEQSKITSSSQTTLKKSSASAIKNEGRSSETHKRKRSNNELGYSLDFDLLDMGFSGGSGSFVGFGSSFRLGDYGNVINLEIGLKYNLFGGSSSNDKDYTSVTFPFLTLNENGDSIEDIGSGNLPYLTASQLSIPAYLRFNLANKRLRSKDTGVEWFVAFGASYNMNIDGQYKRYCVNTNAGLEYDKFGNSELSLVNKANVSSLARVGFIIKTKSKTSIEVAFDARYDLSPMYNVDAANTPIEYYGSQINFYNDYEYIRDQIDQKIYLGLSLGVNFSLK